MGIRRLERELSMQALFFMDMTQDYSEENIELFLQNFAPAQKGSLFMTKLVRGVLGRQAEIDSLIERFSNNWKLSRMGGVDRNTMRVAVYELLCCADIPPKVSINEAIDIGKKFGTEESGAFINGILDSIHMALHKDAAKADQTINHQP